ncbi:hypothetical protein [Agromyces sp. SYSU T00194]|uniref:hypothetical protein n=1 Tax=Agromyces chitinivorans TaxID=3158560 RepID=UPI00339A3521
MKALGYVLLGLVSAAAIATAGFAAVLIMGVRSKDPRVIEPFLKFQRNVANPEVLKTAGREGQRTAIIHHVGRRTGTEYATPISPARIDDGFVVALPYGAGVNWVRNVQAAGSAVLQHEGEHFVVGDPEVVPIAETRLAADEPWTVKIFGLTEALVLRT